MPPRGTTYSVATVERMLAQPLPETIPVWQLVDDNGERKALRIPVQPEDYLGALHKVRALVSAARDRSGGQAEALAVALYLQGVRDSAGVP